MSHNETFIGLQCSYVAVALLLMANNTINWQPSEFKLL